MPRYCKAYKLEDLRKYPQWGELADESGKELDDDSIVYIEETLIVTSNCLELDKKEDYLVTDPTPEWETFCKGELEFQVPDWEAESAQVREALKKAEAEKAAKEGETEKEGEDKDDAEGE